MSRPSLSKSRRGEQLIHHPLDGVWGRIGEKGFGLLRRRWQPNKIKREPAEQRFPIRVDDWLHPCLFHRGQQEAVNLAAGPANVLHRGCRRRNRFLQRPVAAALSDISRPGCGRSASLCGLGSRLSGARGGVAGW